MLTEITPVLKPDIACHLPHNTVGSFGGDEADFALQTRVECRTVEMELVLTSFSSGQVALAHP